MTTYIDECEACTRCLGCGRRWCPNETPSPGEGDGLCVECWLAEDGGAMSSAGTDALERERAKAALGMLVGDVRAFPRDDVTAEDGGS